MDGQAKTPTVQVQSTEAAPVKTINHRQLRGLGRTLRSQFDQYAKDRRQAEDKWLRNLRQYLGIYDPDIVKKLDTNRSQAYPRLTRVKCISVLSRIMDLMFPGNEKNWSLKASPSAEIPEQDVRAVLQQKQAEMSQPGQPPAQMTPEMANMAVQELADKRAKEMEKAIEDQLSELGGSQMKDYVALNRKVADSGIKYGVGVLRGPFVKQTVETRWTLDDNGNPYPRETKRYKPQFEFLSVWDYYPDMGCSSLVDDMDGYFIRKVMTKPQLRKLAQRDDFFAEQIKEFIKNNSEGNHVVANYEQLLKDMGTKAEASAQMRKPGGNKFEVIVWYGPVDAATMQDAGIDVPDRHKADDVEAEIWMLGDVVIKADISPWYKLGMDVRMTHVFEFDEDDTSPVGNGLPNIVRDSQMSVAAAARMLLDNASVVCGPNLEVNIDLLLAGQDFTSTHAYKTWQRDGTGADAQAPAVKNIQIDGHMDELLKVIELFMNFADLETFVGPHTGGDMANAPSEPMRTAAGASMLRGNAALPFKDIVRNFDSFTQSVIFSLVQFNRKFNPGLPPAGDYNVVARGATSMIAKEIRGMQLDQLATTMSDDERVYVDERKLVTERFAVRDVEDILVSDSEAKKRLADRAERQKRLDDEQQRMVQAELRKVLAEAFKDISQGQKNAAAADATATSTALDILEKGVEDALTTEAAATGAGQQAGGPQGVN